MFFALDSNTTPRTKLDFIATSALMTYSPTSRLCEVIVSLYPSAFLETNKVEEDQREMKRYVRFWGNAAKARAGKALEGAAPLSSLGKLGLGGGGGW